MGMNEKGKLAITEVVRQTIFFKILTQSQGNLGRKNGKKKLRKLKISTYSIICGYPVTLISEQTLGNRVQSIRPTRNP